MANFTYGTDWFASKIVEHTEVVRAESLLNGIVKIYRANLSSITVAPIVAELIDLAAIRAILDEDTPTVVNLIPRKGHYKWDARSYALDRGSTLQTAKELHTFLREPDPRNYMNKDVYFCKRAITQHNKVRSLQMICEGLANVRRYGTSAPIPIAFEYEYEFTQEAVVRAIDHHPAAGVILNMNPNGSPTEAAGQHARDAGKELVKLKDLMGRLRDADFGTAG